LVGLTRKHAAGKWRAAQHAHMFVKVRHLSKAAAFSRQGYSRFGFHSHVIE